MNKTVYTLFADPSAIEDVDKVKELINRVVGSALMQDGVEQLTNKDKQYVVLAKQLTLIRLKKLRMPICMDWDYRRIRSELS